LRTIERQALIAVIENALLVSYGEAHGWAPSAAEVADAYQLVIQRRGGEAASLRQVASEYLTVDQDRSVMRNRLVTQQVLDHFLAGLHQPVQTVQYRMIVTSSRAQAEQVRILLQRSDRWVDLAAQYSHDPVGKAQGGEQPFLTKGQGRIALAARIFSLPIGKLSAPIHLKQGWAVIEVLRRLPSPDQLQQDNARYYAWIDALLRKARITSYISLA
jgi:parvulin-like peptidyl-prolyl isomerase